MRFRLIEDYTDDERYIASRTSRSKGSSAFKKDGTPSSVVYNYVLNNVDPNLSVLDYGSGRDAIQAGFLIDNGFTNVTAYDFDERADETKIDFDALSKQFDVVYASNVLNVSTNEQMLRNTIGEIWNCVKDGGIAIFNYPAAPRKGGFETEDVANIIRDVTGQTPNVVGGTPKTPIWEIMK